jgi:GNAT superfamily N-acetyltransferase
MIRRATEDDIPRLVEMGQALAAYASYGAPYVVERVEAVIRGCMAKGIVLVADQDGNAVGLFLGVKAPIWFSDVEVATEIAMWVEPEKRGSRIVWELLDAFVQWAKECGVNHASVSDFYVDGSFPVSALYKRRGFYPIEQTYVRRF